jgi:hypothetical protein
MSQQPDTSNKVWVGVGAGAITTIVVWALKQWAKVDVPTEVAMALSTVISIAAAHYTPINSPKDPDDSNG